MDDTARDPEGCGRTSWATGRYSLQHAGVERAFRVRVPSTYDPAVPAPLILAFHGWGGDGGEFVDDPLVTREAGTHCQDDDVQFVLQLLEEAADSLCIDTRRVYAVGGSNGGMFTWELGQNEASAGRFAALAPIIGLPHRGYLDPRGARAASRCCS